MFFLGGDVNHLFFLGGDIDTGEYSPRPACHNAKLAPEFRLLFARRADRRGRGIRPPFAQQELPPSHGGKGAMLLLALLTYDPRCGRERMNS